MAASSKKSCAQKKDPSPSFPHVSSFLEVAVAVWVVVNEVVMGGQCEVVLFAVLFPEAKEILLAYGCS